MLYVPISFKITFRASHLGLTMCFQSQQKLPYWVTERSEHRMLSPGIPAERDRSLDKNLRCPEKIICNDRLYMKYSCCDRHHNVTVIWHYFGNLEDPDFIRRILWIEYTERDYISFSLKWRLKEWHSEWDIISRVNLHAGDWAMSPSFRDLYIDQSSHELHPSASAS